MQHQVSNRASDCGSSSRRNDDCAVQVSLGRVSTIDRGSKTKGNRFRFKASVTRNACTRVDILFSIGTSAYKKTGTYSDRFKESVNGNWSVPSTFKVILTKPHVLFSKRELTFRVDVCPDADKLQQTGSNILRMVFLLSSSVLLCACLQTNCC